MDDGVLPIPGGRMIFVRPGETRLMSVTGAPTGLVGTIGVRVEDDADTVVLARATAGIDEFAAGAYRRAVTFPDVGGQYYVIWDRPGGEEAVEEVIVSFDASAALPPMGHYFDLAYARKLAPLDDESAYPDDEVEEARDDAEEMLEEAAGVAFVPRQETVVVDGPGHADLFLPRPKARAVIAASVGGVALTGDELAAITPTSGGAYRAAGWPQGRNNIVVTYEHGYPQPPRRIRRAARILTKALLVDRLVDDRASRIEVEGGLITFATARGESFDLPDVNAAIRQHRFRSVG